MKFVRPHIFDGQRYYTHINIKNTHFGRILSEDVLTEDETLVVIAEKDRGSGKEVIKQLYKRPDDIITVKTPGKSCKCGGVKTNNTEDDYFIPVPTYKIGLQEAREMAKQGYSIARISWNNLKLTYDKDKFLDDNKKLYSVDDEDLGARDWALADFQYGIDRNYEDVPTIKVLSKYIDEYIEQHKIFKEFDSKYNLKNLILLLCLYEKEDLELDKDQRLIALKVQGYDGYVYDVDKEHIREIYVRGKEFCCEKGQDIEITNCPNTSYEISHEELKLKAVTIKYLPKLYAARIAPKNKSTYDKTIIDYIVELQNNKVKAEDLKLTNKDFIKRLTNWVGLEHEDKLKDFIYKNFIPVEYQPTIELGIKFLGKAYLLDLLYQVIENSKTSIKYTDDEEKQFYETIYQILYNSTNKEIFLKLKGYNLDSIKTLKDEITKYLKEHDMLMDILLMTKPENYDLDLLIQLIMRCNIKPVEMRDKIIEDVKANFFILWNVVKGLIVKTATKIEEIAKTENPRKALDVTRIAATQYLIDKKLIVTPTEIQWLNIDEYLPHKKLWEVFCYSLGNTNDLLQREISEDDFQKIFFITCIVNSDKLYDVIKDNSLDECMYQKLLTL